jgi:hypothetical protein
MIVNTENIADLLQEALAFLSKFHSGRFIETFTDAELTEYVTQCGLSPKEIFSYGKDKFRNIYQLNNVIKFRINDLVLRHELVTICRKYGKYADGISYARILDLFKKSGKTYKEIADRFFVTETMAYLYINNPEKTKNNALRLDLYIYLKGANNVVENAV